MKRLLRYQLILDDETKKRLVKRENCDLYNSHSVCLSIGVICSRIRHKNRIDSELRNT
jgi:hypothetical protein